ncbi:RNA polymerase sigma factor [Brevibacillus sp. FIR094]|uniref:RNA polymerase sigma factor n=1 Tax=Brevibacillus sp. FIR094 TaxID=3134809 RepID=UPI003D248595
MPEDRELIEQIQAGNHQLYSQIIHRYKGKIVTYLYKMIGNMPDAQDLAQDVFTKTFYLLKDYRPEHKFSSWLYRIASNHCLDEMRRRKRTLWTPASGEEKGKTVITVEGTLGKDMVSIKYWYVKDENRKIYHATLRPESTRDKDGRVLVKGELVIPKLEQAPKKLTISYPEYTVEHDVNWEVPFEIK